MTFKVGDTVQVIDQTTEGEVVSIKGSTVEIVTQDAFLMSFKSNQVLKKEPFVVSALSSAVIREKGDLKQVVAKKAPLPELVWEVDIHARCILKSTKGMTNFEILSLQVAYAKRKLEQATSSGVRRIIFIHGVGEGVLKMELATLLRRHNITSFNDADYRIYGSGATEVHLF